MIDYKPILQKIPALGDNNTDVKQLQERLKLLGHDPGSADGRFGPKTAAAISELQKSNGLPGSGVIGPKTLALLHIAIEPLKPDGSDWFPKTRDLKGRKSRHLHPELRFRLEQKLFAPSVPQCFIDGDVQKCVVAVAGAMESLHVREVGGNNLGHDVGLIQSIIGSQSEHGNGDAWCMSTDQCVIAFVEDYFQLESPVLDSEGCLETLAAARKIPGLVTIVAEPGSFFIGEHQNNPGHGHTGTVISVDGSSMLTFEGNTGDVVNDGPDGAYFRTRGVSHIGSDLYLKGFIRCYPDHQLPKGS